MVLMCYTRKPFRCVGGQQFATKHFGTHSSSTLGRYRPAFSMSCKVAMHAPVQGMQVTCAASQWSRCAGARSASSALLCCCAAGCWALGSHCYQ